MSVFKMSDAKRRALAKYRDEYLNVYNIPYQVRVDKKMPLGRIECYTLTRANKERLNVMVRNLPFYVTVYQLHHLSDNDGNGSCIGRTQYGPYVELKCFNYRVMAVRKLSYEDQEAYRRSLYEEEEE